MFATGWRAPDHSLDPAVVDEVLADASPVVTFLCSPNNPTGRAEPDELVAHVLAVAPGLVVVDEAYGQFAERSAVDLVRERGSRVSNDWSWLGRSRRPGPWPRAVSAT